MVTAYVLNAFTKDSRGGNPAGVVINDTDISEADMQLIAKTLDYSETAFVETLSFSTHKIRFFTPEREVDICGHATVASYHLLGSKYVRGSQRISAGNYILETKAGQQRVYYGSDERVTMTQNLPEYGETLESSIIAESLGLKENDFADSEELPIQIASTGLPKIFAPVEDLATLHSIKPDYDKIKSISEDYGAIGIYAYSLETVHGDSLAHCRNFAPLVGIEEDAATGTSAAALSCLLYNRGVRKALRAKNLSIEQGYAINNPSEIIVNLMIEEFKIVEVMVGGSATLIDSHEFDI